MNFMRIATLSTIFMGAAILLLPAPTSAAPLGAAGVGSAGALTGGIVDHVEQVQRRGRVGPRRGGGRRGGGAGAAAVGIGIGIVGGMIAAGAAAAADQAAVDECARRYRSYDRATRTFIGRDGFEYSCP